MKNNILFFAIILLSLNCYAQVTYEKGYFINNANQKIHCLIKNVDWRNNPTAFEYKLSENDTSQIANIKTVKEFGVTHFSKYVRRTVNIDRYSVDINELSKKRAQQKGLHFRICKTKDNIYIQNTTPQKPHMYS